MNKEEWRDIAGYEGKYQVSTLGHVRSLTRVVSHRNGSCPKYGRLLKQTPNTKGYLLVGPTVNRIQRTRPVHRLVAETFIPRPEGAYEVNHKNGVKTDNRVENLEWVSADANMKHAVANGLRALGGGKAHWAKLQARDIPDIRARIARGESLGSIGRLYGVDHSSIRAIKTGRSWRRCGGLGYEVKKVEVEQ
jgi:hypothetical protein